MVVTKMAQKCQKDVKDSGEGISMRFFCRENIIKSKF
jgi:hypothetical protein